MHIKRINEMSNYGKYATYFVQGNNGSEDTRWEIVVGVKNQDEDDEINDMFYDYSNTSDEFILDEIDYGNTGVFGDKLTFLEFKKMFMEQEDGKNTLHNYTMNSPVGDIYENNIYYDDKLRKDMLQLSDERLLWKIENDNFDETKWNLYCQDLVDSFEETYNTEIYLLGRSGRHVCVDNTVENKLRFYDMQKTVEDMQKELVYEFSNND